MHSLRRYAQHHLMVRAEDERDALTDNLRLPSTSKTATWWNNCPGRNWHMTSGHPQLLTEPSAAADITIARPAHQ